MKIQIDFDNLVIKVEDKVNMKELMDAIKMMLPDGYWKEFELDTNTVINNWTYPIVVNPYTPLVNPWTNTNPIWCGTGTITPNSTGTLTIGGTTNTPIGTVNYDVQF